MINPMVWKAVLKHNETGEFIPVIFSYDEDDAYDEGDWYIHDEGFPTVDEAWNRGTELEEQTRREMLAEANPETCDTCGHVVEDKPKRVLDYD